MPDDLADDNTVLQNKAALLSAWTHLSDVQFGACYIAVRPAGSLEWELIVALGGTKPKLKACEEAEQAGFLDNLVREVANREQHEGRPIAEIAAILDTVRGYGLMQGMTDQQKGFMSAEILMPLLQARDACAIVARMQPLYEQLGTAFLVRPDLVLTAAHVVMKIEDGNGKRNWSPELSEGLTFRFKARPNQPSHHLIEVRPAAVKPLVSCALPHGSPPNLLDQALDARAGALLDFALIRLAQRVEHVRPVDIVETASVRKGKTCWAFGFPGGTGLMMDVDIVTEIHEGSGRWLHRANAAAGMSGGCCVNHEGQIAGLHEGTLDIPVNGTSTRRNRGISIAAIRRAQLGDGRDPLKSQASAPGLEFQDAALVDEWYEAGKRLGGDALAAQWRDAVTLALGKIDPESGAPMPPFHPWFARPDVEKWIDAAEPLDRLCFIRGGQGVGKSFCARILREKLASRDADLIVFNPTQVNAMDWIDAIGPVLVPDVADNRTAAASVRYNDLDAVIEELRRRSANGTQRCFVAIDFGPAGGNGRFTGTQWIELVAALTASEWVRVMLIGLDEFERDVMIDRMDLRPETSTVAIADVELAPVGRNEFLKYLKELAIARGKRLTEKQARERMDEALPAAPPLPAHLCTVTAVRAAMALERKLALEATLP